MFEPSQKSEGIESLLTAITGKSRPDTIKAGQCTTCDATGLTTASFTDDLSRKEYTISGMCQACQDSVFGTDPFDISQDLPD